VTAPPQLAREDTRPEGVVASGLSTGPLERVGAGEQPYDYCLLSYPPVADPDGKLASVAILRELFAFSGVEAEGMALVDALCTGLGPGRTVWGVKARGTSEPLTFELYFYKRDRPGPPLEIETVLEILAPHLSIDAELDRPVDWLMFSIEFSPQDLRARRGDGLTLYVHGSDLSYDLRGRRLTMGNLYRFFDPRSQIRQILAQIEACVHYDPRGPDLGRLIPPRLFRAHHICVASKRTADGMYFSRVSFAGLRWFLDAFDWPAPVRAFVDTHAEALDYLMHDVGFDYALEGGTLTFGKSGFYGYF
jgi:hypothetical protein